jgi:hypothetical protein
MLLAYSPRPAAGDFRSLGKLAGVKQHLSAIRVGFHQCGYALHERGNGVDVDVQRNILWRRAHGSSPFVCCAAVRSASWSCGVLTVHP